MYIFKLLPISIVHAFRPACHPRQGRRFLPSHAAVPLAAEVAIVILRVLDEIRKIAKDVKANDKRASRLLARVAAIEPPVRKVEQGTRLSTSESLRQLLATVEDVRNLLDGYARATLRERTVNRKNTASKFKKIGAKLTEGMQALQLDVVVEVLAKEDEADRVDDNENMLDALESMRLDLMDGQKKILDAVKVSVERVSSYLQFTGGCTVSLFSPLLGLLPSAHYLLCDFPVR